MSQKKSTKEKIVRACEASEATLLDVIGEIADEQVVSDLELVLSQVGHILDTVGGSAWPNQEFPRPQVVVIVRGGVAEAFYDREEVDVLVKDYDNLIAEEEPIEAKRQHHTSPEVGNDYVG